MFVEVGFVHERPAANDTLVFRVTLLCCAAAAILGVRRVVVGEDR